MSHPTRDADARFSIAALIAKYKLEPKLKDLFVEGKGDEIVWARLKKRENLPTLEVYTINNVNVPAALHEPHFGDGNRGRVVALAHQLSCQLPRTIENVACVADKDLDSRLGPSCACDRLWLTDFNCMESYLFIREFIEDFFASYFGRKLPLRHFDDICKICVATYWIRVAKSKLCPELPWVPITRTLSIQAGQIEFDRPSMMERLLIHKGRRELVPEFDKSIEELISQNSGDLRNTMHKDDFIEVLGWVAKEMGAQQELCKFDVVHRVILSHLGPSDLSNYQLFTEVISWASEDGCTAISTQ